MASALADVVIVVEVIMLHMAVFVLWFIFTLCSYTWVAWKISVAFLRVRAPPFWHPLWSRCTPAVVAGLTFFQGGGWWPTVYDASTILLAIFSAPSLLRQWLLIAASLHHIFAARTLAVLVS
jgi:hypothetical protein